MVLPQIEVPESGQAGEDILGKACQGVARQRQLREPCQSVEYADGQAGELIPGQVQARDADESLEVPCPERCDAVLAQGELPRDGSQVLSAHVLARVHAGDCRDDGVTHLRRAVAHTCNSGRGLRGRDDHRGDDSQRGG